MSLRLKERIFFIQTISRVVSLYNDSSPSYAQHVMQYEINLNFVQISKIPMRKLVKSIEMKFHSTPYLAFSYLLTVNSIVSKM